MSMRWMHRSRAILLCSAVCIVGASGWSGSLSTPGGGPVKPDRTHPPGGVSTPLSLPRLGRPVLTLWDAVGQALAIAPVFNIAFVIPLVVGVSGAATPFTIVLATACVLCMRWVITLYARRYVGAGGVYDYM